MAAPTLRISGTVHDSIVDGPGLRYVVFTQGCPHQCAGCHNPHTHDPSGGKAVTLDTLVADLLSNPLTDGLTLTGGEPFAQPDACAILARAAKTAGQNVWCYTGYTLEALRTMPEMAVLLAEIDVLVDGPYIEAARSLTLSWRGSENQRVIPLTEQGERCL